ncbi:MAG: hypothetical protein RLZZ347_347 [Candidatus Parcubacteria bacterium]|jgi:ComF family protein
MIIQKVIDIAKVGVGKIIGIIFPTHPDITLLEHTTASEFRALVPKASQGTITEKWIYAILGYSDPLVRTAIWELKYRGNTKIVDLLAQVVYEEIVSELSDLALFSSHEKVILIPVPISPARLRERGWNQTELLAQKLTVLDSGTFFTLDTKSLLKIKDTPSQTKSKHRAEREKNLKGCFKVTHPEAIADKHILLLDDVCTTGSTLREARKTLLKAGARAVYAITVAH